MNEKIPSEKDLLTDRHPDAAAQTTGLPLNPEVIWVDQQIAALRAELGIETPLPYDPAFNLEVLQWAKTFLQTDWADADSISRLRETLLTPEQKPESHEHIVILPAVDLMAARLSRLGGTLRRDGNPAGAELVYRVLNHYCTDIQRICTARIQLAEMIRRREIPVENPAAELSQLLRFPIQEGYGTALMNLALFLAARPETEVPHAVWLDDLCSCMGTLSHDGAQDARLYWEALGMQADPEGYLAHALLMLFGKIEESPLGSLGELLRRVDQGFPDIGRRIARFTAVDDAGNEIECELLFTFESDETGKLYLVYTDHSLDEEGNTTVYANVWDGRKLLPVETERERKTIAILLERLKAEEDTEG